jgi:hypothetical protein
LKHVAVLDAPRTPLLRPGLMRAPSGKVSLGGLVLLALLAGAIYVAAMLVPVYVDNLTVKEAVTAAHNRAIAVFDERAMLNTILERTNRLGYHWEYDKFGKATRVPGLGLKPEQIVIERSEVTSSVLVRVEYDRTVRFKPSKYVRTIHFRVEKEGIPGQR